MAEEDDLVIPQKAQAAKILDQAIALQPRDADARRELAGVLAVAGKYAEAQQLFKGVTLEARDRFSLAQLYCAQQQFVPALEQIRAFFKRNYDLLRLEGGHVLAESTKEQALQQVLHYWRKLKAVATTHPECPLRVAMGAPVMPSQRPTV